MLQVLNDVTVSQPVDSMQKRRLSFINDEMNYLYLSSVVGCSTAASTSNMKQTSCCH